MLEFKHCSTRSKILFVFFQMAMQQHARNLDRDDVSSNSTRPPTAPTSPAHPAPRQQIHNFGFADDGFDWSTTPESPIVSPSAPGISQSFSPEYAQTVYSETSRTQSAAPTAPDERPRPERSTSSGGTRHYHRMRREGSSKIQKCIQCYLNITFESQSFISASKLL